MENLNNTDKTSENADKELRISDVSESYSIVIDNVSNFRYELIKMIEKVRYNVDGYDNLSSSQIAEIFERKVNSH